MPSKNVNGGATASAISWMKESWRPLLAEVISTLLLMCLSISSSLPGADGKAVPLVYTAIATSCLVAANVASFGEFSGAHMNPALTLTAVLGGNMSPMLGLGYMIAQCLGAVLGFVILAGLMPQAREASFGVILPASEISPFVAMAYEVLLTCVVMCVVSSVLSSSERNPVVPVNLGVAVIAAIMSGALISGACINPARSLSAAIYHNNWKHQWVYVIGPFGGSCVAAAIRRVLTPPRSGKSNSGIMVEPEEIPFEAKP